MDRLADEKQPGAGAEAWYLSTLRMAQLAGQAGIRSYHFLQPSLHLEGAKPLSAAEKALAKVGAKRYGPPSKRGYPALLKWGSRLREQSVAFHDLSNVFQGKEQTLYVDECCHFNPEGNKIMAQAIARAIAQD